MSTDPRSLHDAMRRMQNLLGVAALDLNNYIGGDDARYDELSHVVYTLKDAQDVVAWVKETYEHGVRRS